MIILLDHNYTLVENSLQKRTPFVKQIEAEKYRQWLVDLVKAEYVILITARPVKYQSLTLESVRRKTGWSPQEAYFNHLNLSPPRCKDWALKNVIFPGHGPDAPYLAIESNPKTRAMYARHGIKTVYVKGGEPWLALPR